jgi:hypothetical protein
VQAALRCTTPKWKNRYRGLVCFYATGWKEKQDLRYKTRQARAELLVGLHSSRAAHYAGQYFHLPKERSQFPAGYSGRYFDSHTGGPSLAHKAIEQHLWKTESLQLPTRPDGTDVKNGPSPSIWACMSCDGAGCMNAAASAAVANCGIRVSNFVDTTTVRESVGSTCTDNIESVSI